MTKTDYICGLIIAGLCLVGVILGDLQAMEQTAIEQQANSAARILSAYGYAVLAALSPLISWRVVQWYKLDHKRKHNKKPPARRMDIIGLLLVFAFCSFALYKHGIDFEGALFISVIVSIFHTAIVKYIFAKAPKQIVDALSYGAQSDHTMMTIFAGRDRRNPGRALDELTKSGNADYERTRVLTPEERDEITGPK